MTLAGAAEAVGAGGEGGDDGGVVGEEEAGEGVDGGAGCAEGGFAVAVEGFVGGAGEVEAFDGEIELEAVAEAEGLQKAHVPGEETGLAKGIADGD